MININCTEERWSNLMDNLQELAQGNLSKRLTIDHINDDFETLEALLNWVSEEWQQRALQMTFNKPSESQKFTKHFQIVLNKDLTINCTDSEFVDYMAIDEHSCMNQKIANFMKESDYELLCRKIRELDLPNSKTLRTPSLALFGQDFMFSVTKMASGELYVLNLFQIQLHAKHFRKGLSKEPKEYSRYEQKKLYRDRIADVKKYINGMPLNQVLILEKVCKKFMLNSLQLKKGFKELYQSTAYDYFIKRRMSHAHLLIRTSNVSLKEISQMIGYAHYSTFSHNFNAIYNIRPKALRLQRSIHPSKPE